MKVSIPCAAALALFPLVSAFPAPTAAPNILNIKYGRDVLEAREMRPRQGPVTPTPPQEVTSAKSTSASSSSTPTSTPPPSSSSSSTPPSSSSEPPSASPSSSTTPPPPPSSSSSHTASAIVRTSASKTQIASTQEDGQITLVTTEIIISITDTPTPTPSNNPPSQDNGSSGISSSTIIGLSVAGGLTVLAGIAFIAWKLTRKRFSQFDTDDGVINWPDLQKDPEVAPPRPAPSVSAGTTTSSTVDLVKDPYAVPPLPPNNGGLGPYRDDASSFYDPYRGPVPQAFSTPPASTDGHQQGWVGGEAIPMNTYGRTSPGPNFAYGGGGVDPMQRTGTPVQRMATPVQRMATPVGGAATFHEIVRSGTPGAAPYRTGTPGYGYGGR